MMKLKVEQIYNLYEIVVSLPMADLKLPKEVKLNLGTAHDLKEKVKEYADLIESNNVKREDVRKLFQGEMNVALKKATPEKVAGIQQEFSQKLNAELAIIAQELEVAQKALGSEEKELELSIEKMAKLKEWFPKYSTTYFYSNEKGKMAYLAIADQLQLLSEE